MSVQTGRQCVQDVIDICTAVGFYCWCPPKENGRPWDLIVNGKRVQVKYRSVEKSTNKKRVRLKTYLGSASIAYKSGDFDFLVIYWNRQWFVIPESAIVSCSGTIRNGLYMPDFVLFIDGWPVLSGDYQAVEAQKSFEF